MRSTNKKQINFADLAEGYLEYIGTNFVGTDNGEGVGDNGSGVALILATAVGLVNTTTAYNVKYVVIEVSTKSEFATFPTLFHQ